MADGNFMIPDCKTIENYGTSLEMISFEITAKIERFNTDVSSFEHEVDVFIKKVQNKLTELQVAIQEVQNEINDLNEKINRYQKVFEENEQKISQIKEQENEIKTQIRQLEEEIRRIEQSDDENKAQKIAELRERIRVLKEKLAVYMQRRMELEKLNAEIKTTLNYLKNTLAEVSQKQQLYMDKYTEIQNEGYEFYANWQEIMKGIDNADISNNVLSANEDLIFMSDAMKNLAISVSEIEWGYSDGQTG